MIPVAFTKSLPIKSHISVEAFSFFWQDVELCIRAENVVLPKNGFFGLSAATGGLADDHDVLKFITHSLRSPDLSLGRDLF